MYPVRNYSFVLEMEGIQVGFAEVSGVAAKVKGITCTEGMDILNSARKLPGLLECGQLTLKRFADNAPALLNWINDADEGRIEKKTVTLTALDDDKKPAAVWKIINAWPASYGVSDLGGAGNEVVLDTLILTHEGMTRDM